MNDQTELTKINVFLALAAPVVIGFVKTLLEAADFEVTQEGSGSDFAFGVKSGEQYIKFFLQNLLLEIATVDRDAEPLKFDERLADFNFFISKTADVVESKLRILPLLLGETDVDTVIENVISHADTYERLRIIKLDPKPN
jgi:hypothetical protein